MWIGNRKIGPGHAPFIIAEISGNHKGEFGRAKALIEAAGQAGVDAVKLQTYTADTITIDCEKDDFRITDPDSLWHGRTLHSLYDEAHTPWEWHQDLFDYARSLGMEAFSTPFDETAVSFLETCNVPCYKIASFEHTFIPLLKQVAATGKPVIISCGLASLDEISETVDTVRAAGAQDLCLLCCTSSYPASIEDSNLRTIPDMRLRFPDAEIGLSDHTLGGTAATVAVALGATVIEKHLTLEEDDGAVDGGFSLTPAQMTDYVQQLRDAFNALGGVHYGSASQKEDKSKQFRRSIYVVDDIKSGQILTPDNIRCIRPGYGLPTKYYEAILGKRAAMDLTRGTALEAKMLEGQDI